MGFEVEVPRVVNSNIHTCRFSRPNGTLLHTLTLMLSWMKVLELTAREMASLDEDELLEAMSTVDVLVGELVRSPKDVWQSICVEYTDLYLNPYYILSMRARIPKVGIYVGDGVAPFLFFFNPLIVLGDHWRPPPTYPLL